MKRAWNLDVQSTLKKLQRRTWAWSSTEANDEPRSTCSQQKVLRFPRFSFSTAASLWSGKKDKRRFHRGALAHDAHKGQQKSQQSRADFFCSQNVGSPLLVHPVALLLKQNVQSMVCFGLCIALKSPKIAAFETGFLLFLAQNVHSI